MKHLLFCDVAQGGLVVGYRRFGSTYRSHLNGSRSPRTVGFLKRRNVVCPKTSVMFHKSEDRSCTVMENHMGGSCSTHGKAEKYTQDFGRETWNIYQEMEEKYWDFVFKLSPCSKCKLFLFG